MRPIIEFCTNNMHFGTDEVMEKLEENPDYDVIEYGCLSNCGQCAMMPFAMVNGEIIDADSADELYGQNKRTRGLGQPRAGLAEMASGLPEYPAF